MTATASRTAPGGLRTLEVVARLGKLTVYQHYYGPALAALVLLGGDARAGVAVAACALHVVAVAGMVAATSALDDLTGYRNGSDRRNYEQPDSLRDIRRKPLLAGTLPVRGAQLTAVGGQLVALVAGVAGFAVAGRADPVAVTLFALAWVLSCQYSWGLRLSYRTAGGEALLLFSTAASLLWPLLGVSREHWGTGLVQAALLACWMLNVSLYSNLHDAPGDREVGRRTIAVLFPRRVTHAVLVGLFAGTVALVAGGALAGVLPAWAFAALLPVWLTQARQLRLEVARGLTMRARALGFRTFNRGFAGLALVDAILIIQRGGPW